MSFYHIDWKKEIQLYPNSADIINDMLKTLHVVIN